MADAGMGIARDDPATSVGLAVFFAVEIALSAMHSPMIVIVLVILASTAFLRVSARKRRQPRVFIPARLKFVYDGLVVLPVGLIVSIIVALTNGTYAALTVALTFTLMSLFVSSAIVFRWGRRSEH